MANSYENTKMPEKKIEQIKPDAIPVDDKGQPLPDPTENLSSYLAPKGVEELKKAYSEVEVDEDVRKTMEPPQKSGFLRKHRAGKRGYGYYGYGTPTGKVPNDSNGLKPSPLSELFSEAEALEPDFDLDKIREHVLQQPQEGSQFTVVETPKLDPSLVKNADSSDGKSGEILKRPEVVKDPNAPKFLDMYKESTNTRVIYQSDSSENGAVQNTNVSDDAKEIFAEHSQVTKAKKKLNKREEKKAIKAAIKTEKKKAKERRKAEKAARKAAKKAAKKGLPSVTPPEDIIKLINENSDKSEENNQKIEQAVNDEKEIKAAQAEALKAAEEKAEAEKQLEIANRQKEEAELEAQRAAQEAEKRIQEEKDALLKQQEETKAAQEEKEQALLKLDEEKAAAQQAAEEAKSAREEAERLKAELEAMKEAAAQALAQKQEAEEAARIAREEKLNEEMQAIEENKKKKAAEDAEKRAQKKKRDEAQQAEIEKIRKERDEAIAKAKAEKEAAVEKAREKKEAEIAKAKAEKNAAIEKAKQSSNKKESDGASSKAPSTMEVIKRRIAEMEAQLSSNDKNEE